MNLTDPYAARMLRIINSTDGYSPLERLEAINWQLRQPAPDPQAGMLVKGKLSNGDMP